MKPGNGALNRKRRIRLQSISGDIGQSDNSENEGKECHGVLLTPFFGRDVGSVAHSGHVQTNDVLCRTQGNAND